MERPLRGDWGNRNSNDFLYQIGFDFVAQLEDIMEREEIGRTELAQRLDVSKGRVSQILNNPGNLGLENVVKYARALKHKVAIVAYNDGDTANHNGPISPQVFVACWEKGGRPTDMFSASAVAAASVETDINERWAENRGPGTGEDHAANVGILPGYMRYKPSLEDLKHAGTDAVRL